MKYKSSVILTVITVVIASLMAFSFGCAKKEEKEIVTCPDPNKRYFEGGETLTEQSERVWKGLQEIVRKHAPEDTVVIFSHLTVIASLLCRIFNVSLSNIWLWGGSMKAEHPSITTIVHDNGRWYLQHYGCAEHLC